MQNKIYTKRIHKTDNIEWAGYIEILTFFINQNPKYRIISNSGT